MVTVGSDHHVTINTDGKRSSTVLRLPQILDARVAHGLVDAVVSVYRATGHEVVDQRWKRDPEVIHHDVSCMSCGFTAPF